MDYKQAIFKEKEVDLTATVAQLDVHQAVKICPSTRLTIAAIRTAVSRINSLGKSRYSVKNTINYAIITRTI